MCSRLINGRQVDLTGSLKVDTGDKVDKGFMCSRLINGRQVDLTGS
jgi:hypothetical protein